MESLELSPLPQARGALRGLDDSPQRISSLANLLAPAVPATHEPDSLSSGAVNVRATHDPAPLSTGGVNLPATHDPASLSSGGVNTATSIAEEAGGRLWFEPPRAGETVSAGAPGGAPCRAISPAATPGTSSVSPPPSLPYHLALHPLDYLERLLS